MIPHSNHFTQSQPYQGKDTIMTGDGSQMKIHSKGSIIFQTNIGHIENQNVLYVLGLCRTYYLLVVWLKILTAFCRLMQMGSM